MNGEWDSGNAHVGENVPGLDALTRERLGRRMQEMYEPVVDEPLDPRLAELLHALDLARDAAGRGPRASGRTSGPRRPSATPSRVAVLPCSAMLIPGTLISARRF